MIVLGVLQLDLALLLDHGLSVKVLKEQVLEALPPDLNCDCILLLQVLVFTILVTKLGLLVLFLLLGDKPEVVNPETLIVILASRYLFSFNGALEGAGLHT